MKDIDTSKEMVQEEFYQFKFISETEKAADQGLDTVTGSLIAAVIATWADFDNQTKTTINNLIKKLKGYDYVYDNIIPNLDQEIPSILDDVALDIKGQVKVIDPNLNKMKVQGYTLNKIFSSKKIKTQIASAIKTAESSQGLIQDINRINKQSKGLLNNTLTSTITEIREDQKSRDYSIIEDDPEITSYYLSVGTLDSRTSTQCKNLDGAKYTQKYEYIPNKPPRHFNCRSVIILMVDDPQIRASMDGPVTYLTYRQWEV